MVDQRLIQDVSRSQRDELEYCFQAASLARDPLITEMFYGFARHAHSQLMRLRALETEDRRVDLLKKRRPSAQPTPTPDKEQATSAVDALRRTIALESRKAQLVVQLVDTCNVDAERSQAIDLLEQERKHQRELSDSLTFLQDTEMWLMDQQKPFLDGA